MSTDNTGDSNSLLGTIFSYVKSIASVVFNKSDNKETQMDTDPGVEASVPWRLEDSNVPSTSKPSSSRLKGENKETMDEVLRKLMYFNQFDIVEDYSDHHHRDQGLVGNNHQPSKSWTKKIQEEWKILQDNLPETIFVRAYESRMDLMRAAIIGPDGTPYHDGLFFFDIMFPSSYPQTPPVVHYHSGELRINPNLYKNGKVCLSLLGTWSGEKDELWNPNKSAMLQVLISIKALILNSKPFFNEPGYSNNFIFRSFIGEWHSKDYNEKVFLLSLKTMTYSLKNPPKNFEDLVIGHFRIRARDIVTACRLYNEGAAEVGSDIRKIVKEGKKDKNRNSATFKSSVACFVKILIEAFVANGSSDCEKFWTGSSVSN